MDAIDSVTAGRARRRSELTVWLRWVLANVVGEALGFGLGLSVGYALALPFGEPEGALLVVGIVFEIAVVGAIEGLLLGTAQHWVLRDLWPSLRRPKWLRATIAGGILAWGTGMVLGNWAGDQMMSLLGGSWLLGGLVIGVLAGSILSSFQWSVLSSVSDRSWIWIPAHAGAWAIGMVVAFAGVDTLGAEPTVLAVVGTASAVGVGMGVTVAALTGLALVWMGRGRTARWPESGRVR